MVSKPSNKRDEASKMEDETGVSWEVVSKDVSLDRSEAFLRLANSLEESVEERGPDGPHRRVSFGLGICAGYKDNITVTFKVERGWRDERRRWLTMFSSSTSFLTGVPSA